MERRRSGDVMLGIVVVFLAAVAVTVGGVLGVGWLVDHVVDAPKPSLAVMTVRPVAGRIDAATIRSLRAEAKWRARMANRDAAVVEKRIVRDEL